MNYRKLIIVVLALFIVACGAFWWWRQDVSREAHTGEDITDLTGVYLAENEVAAASGRLASGTEPAEVITRLMDGTPQVAIILDGLPERPLAARIIDVLTSHGVVAAFFVEGQNAAEQPETMKLLHEANMPVGNYTFVGVRHLEKLPPEEMLWQLCRTQKVVETLTATTPAMFRAPDTQYDDGLLSAGRAAGLRYAVKENLRFHPREISSDEVAAEIAETIPPGSIIAIEVARPVAQYVVDTQKTDERPEIDKKPTVSDDKPETIPAEGDLADELDRLLTALENRGVTVSSVEGFRKIHYVPEVALLPEEGEEDSGETGEQSEEEVDSEEYAEGEENEESSDDNEYAEE